MEVHSTAKVCRLVAAALQSVKLSARRYALRFAEAANCRKT